MSRLHLIGDMARRELIARLTPVNERGLTDRRSFLKALKQVRKDGYAAAVGDVTFGAAAVAAPASIRRAGSRRWLHCADPRPA